VGTIALRAAASSSKLEDHLSDQDADATLRRVIFWGRYAEIFTYDNGSHTFETFKPLNASLPPHEVSSPNQHLAPELGPEA
jgi:C-terminal AAA-associated domain